MPAGGTIAALVLLGAGAHAPDYQAPPACPNERAFWSEVRERSLSIRSSTTALDVQITITASAAHFLGAVRVSGGAPRALDAQSCDDLTRGLALVTALLVDADPVPPSPPTPAPPAATPAPAPARTPEPAPGVEFSAGAGIAVAFGAVPGAGLGVPLFLDLRWPQGPSLRGVFRRAVNDASDLPLGAASFAWTAGRLEVCPSEWELSIGVAMACAFVEGGVMDVETMRVSAAVSSREPWLGVGAAARARTYFLGAVFLEGSFSLTAPILRTHYFFAPNVEVFETPPVSADLGVGLGISFR